jgi:RNA polymerase sigma-54 factor
MEISLQQKPILTQKLIMTPQLQQVIKLLQLTRVGLLEKIQQELEDSPVLEKVEDSGVEKSTHDAIDWYSYLDPYRSRREKIM